MSELQTSSTELLEKKLREFRALAEMNREIHSTMHIHQLLRILVEKAVVGVNFERCLIYLLEEGYLRCVAWIDRIKKEKASIIEKRVGFHMEENAAEVLAMKTGQPIYIENAFEDPRVSPKILRIAETKEYCITPLIGRNKVLGVLTGDKFYSKAPILSSDIQTLLLFAGHIGLAIENSLLYEEKERFSRVLEKRVHERTAELAEANQELSRKMAELSTLSKMSKLLNQSLHQGAVLDQIIASVNELGYGACSVRLLEESGRYRVAAKRGLGEEYDGFANVDVAESPFSHLLDTPNAFAISDLLEPPVPESFRAYCRLHSIRSCIVVPLLTKGVMIGEFRIYSQDPVKLKETQLDFFSAFGQQAAAALENAIMFEKVLEEKNKIENLSQRIEQENLYLKERIRSDFVIGKSSKMQEVMDLARKVAPTSTTVMLYGETGTGKELIANAVHELSPRKDGPLIKVNCAAIPDELIESELFGHEKGAFTGAHQKHIGMFELANGGTIFLDEIGDLSMRTQTKLLRVLQEQEIQRIGSKAPIRVDVRVIAATNKELRESIQEKAFRSDLFYRLNVFPITLPPLRERKEDIEELIRLFLSQYASIRRLKMTVSQEALNILLAYSWPGNVRELKNMFERLVIISKDGVIERNDLPKELWQDSGPETPIRPLGASIREFKREQVLHALSKAGGKKSTAAEMLGLPRSNFSRLLKSLALR